MNLLHRGPLKTTYLMGRMRPAGWATLF